MGKLELILLIISVVLGIIEWLDSRDLAYALVRFLTIPVFYLIICGFLWFLRWFLEFFIWIW